MRSCREPSEGEEPRRAGESATRATDKAGDLAGRAQYKAGNVSSRAKDRASRLGSQAKQQASRARGGFQRMLIENPLTVGALGVGVGVAIGLAIPETSKEHEVMGEARDTVVEKAPGSPAERSAGRGRGPGRGPAGGRESGPQADRPAQTAIAGAASLGRARGVFGRRTDDTLGTRS